MSARRLVLPLAVFAAAAAAFGFYVENTVANLPVRVATHFASSGAPNGWMTRAQHEKFMLGFGLGMPLCVMLVFIGIRALGGVGLNIPHREYWLAPERREATLDFIVVHGIWFASFMLAFMAGVHRIILLANASAPPSLPSRDLTLTVVGFCSGLGLLLFALLRRFKQPQ